MSRIDLPETVLAETVSPLRQGDIFRWVRRDHAEAEEPWYQFGIIVTADCDIVYDKHRGTLSYVPILYAVDYLRLLSMPPLLQRALSPKMEEAAAITQQLQSKYSPEFTVPLSLETLQAWLRETDGDTVLESLGTPKGGEFDKASAALSLVKRCLETETGDSYDELFSAIVSAKGGLDKHKVNLNKQLQQRLCGLPGDAFFIGEIPRVDEKGFVAYLRLVREISGATVAVKTSQLRNQETRARRIASLTAPYLYRLTQQLGDVFSAIGLPRHYEERREALAHVVIGGTEAENTYK